MIRLASRHLKLTFMSYLTICNETLELVAGFPDRLSNCPLSAETTDESSVEWLAMLREYTLVEACCGAPETHNEHVDAIPSPEIVAPLHVLTPSPWRSVGGYLDYSGWTARERFLELDKAIACSEYSRQRAA